MHKEFADWYRQAGVVPSGELLTARWNGVSSLCDKLSKAELLDLLVLFCRDPGEVFETPAFIDEAFRAHDATFPARGNVLELRVLAGCVIRATIEADKALAIAAAYGLLCGIFGSSKDLIPTTAHIEFAEIFLASKSGHVREPKTLVPNTAPAMTKEALETLFSSEHFSQLPELRAALVNGLVDISKKERLATNKQIAALSQHVSAQREELDMLWWLQNSYSRALSRPFDHLSKDEACLVIAVELASITRFLPGPASIWGMITTSLSRTKGDNQISLKRVVNSLSRSWRESRISEAASIELKPICPVYLALAASMETEGEDDWLPVFYKRSKLDANEILDAQKISYQGYRESLFLKAYAELK